MTYNLAETFKSIQQKNQSSTTQEESVKLIAALIALPVYTTTIWAILTFIFALSIPWLHILGGFLLFNLFRSFIAESFKKYMRHVVCATRVLMIPPDFDDKWYHQLARGVAKNQPLRGLQCSASRKRSRWYRKH